MKRKRILTVRTRSAAIKITVEIDTSGLTRGESMWLADALASESMKGICTVENIPLAKIKVR